MSEPSPSLPTSELLTRLSARCMTAEVCLGDVFEELGHRASGLIVVLLALPFCAPFSVPGMSTPLGIVIMLLAAQRACGVPAWLPGRLLKVKLPPKFFRLVFQVSGKTVRSLEKVLRPRLGWMQKGWHAWVVVVAGALLALPLPPLPPFTNMFPAWVILVTMLGLIEEDGLAVFFGWVLLLLTSAYFVGIFLLGAELVDRLRAWLSF